MSLISLHTGGAGKDWGITSTTRNAVTDPLEVGRLRVVLATIFINIVVVGLLRFVPSSDWRSGLLLNFVDNFLLIGFAIRERDWLLPRFMLFGLVVGITELAADAWLVGHTHTLDYSIGGGPMIWHSPIWMPLAWEIVAVQFGYLGLRLWEWFKVRGLLAIGILGAINIPYYEEMAKHVHWWEYSGCRMISNTPYYVILGEFGIAMCFAILAKRLRRNGWTTPMLTGIVGGAAIFACYALAYGVIDGFHH